MITLLMPGIGSESNLFLYIRDSFLEESVDVSFFPPSYGFMVPDFGTVALH